jgi:hypothetical protein
MIRTVTLVLFAFLSCIPVFATEICNRASLQTAIDSYISAQQTGDPSKMPLADGVKYSENMTTSSIDQSIIQIALPISFHRSFLDVDACKSFTEVIIAKGDHPYVLGVRFELHNDKITEISSIVTDEGDWEFNADNYLNASSKENWDILQENQRVDRQTLINAANAYFDMFTYENTKVPWGIPCASLEGGKYSGDGPRTSCKVGIPLEGIEITNRSYVVDVAMGTVNVFCRFGVTQSTRYGKTNGLPDSHTFRLINGKLRYIHSLSVVD